MANIFAFIGLLALSAFMFYMSEYQLFVQPTQKSCKLNVQRFMVDCVNVMCLRVYHAIACMCVCVLCMFHFYIHWCGCLSVCLSVCVHSCMNVCILSYVFLHACNHLLRLSSYKCACERMTVCLCVHDILCVTYILDNPYSTHILDTP